MEKTNHDTLLLAIVQAIFPKFNIALIISEH